MKIAFFGLGNMGLPMAINLQKTHYEVLAFDPVESAQQKAQSAGIKIFKNPSDLAKEKAEITISMLPSGKLVLELYSELLKEKHPNALFIDSSTIAPTEAKEAHALCLEHGASMLDAPVSGGTAAASAGTLTFMVGGSKDSLEKATAVLGCMGKNVFHAGEAGAGQAAKICNNMLLAIHMIGSSEALSLGKANGLDPKVLSEIMLQSSGANWSLEKYNPHPGVMESVPSSNNYAGGFATKLMLKDLSLAIGNSEELKSKTPLGSLAKKLYEEHCNEENAFRDFSSIIESIEVSK